MKVGVIGTGSTGMAITLAIATRPFQGLSRVSEILLHDRAYGDDGLARGDAVCQDVQDALAWAGSARIHHTSVLTDLAECEVVIVSVKADYRVTDLEGDKRRAGLALDLPVIAEVARGLRGCLGRVVVVTNPADVMARVVGEFSGLPAQRVFSFGASLDNARVKSVLAAHALEPSRVHSEFIGEHGPSGVIRWSRLRYDDRPLAFPAQTRLLLDGQVKARGYGIVSRLGTSVAGPARGVAHAVACMVAGGWDLLGVAVRVPQPVGHVHAGVPVVFRDGHMRALLPGLPDAATDELERSELENWRNSLVTIAESTERALALAGMT